MILEYSDGELVVQDTHVVFRPDSDSSVELTAVVLMQAINRLLTVHKKMVAINQALQPISKQETEDLYKDDIPF